MRRMIRVWQGLALGGLSLALIGGVGLPVTALASTSSNSGKTCPMVEHRQAMRTMREKMLARAKAEDATLEKLVAELHKAPEAKKTDLEAAILTNLVAQHHQMLKDWESVHARRMAFWKGRMKTGNTAMSGSCMGHGMMNQSASTAQK